MNTDNIICMFTNPYLPATLNIKPNIRWFKFELERKVGELPQNILLALDEIEKEMK